jgi:hypothetical protein
MNATGAEQLPLQFAAKHPKTPNENYVLNPGGRLLRGKAAIVRPGTSLARFL